MTDPVPSTTRKPRWLPPLVGATVLGFALLVALLLAGPSTSETTDGGRLASIPKLVANYSYLTGLDDEVLRQLALPPEQYLDGPNAWSPDGALLATGIQSWGCQQWTDDWDEAEWRKCLEETEVTFFVNASGRGVPVPAPLRAGLAGSHGVLGWTGAGEVLVLDDVNNSDDEPYWLSSVPLDGGSPHRLSAVPNSENYGVGDFQMAAALVPDMQVREAGADESRAHEPDGHMPFGEMAVGRVNSVLSRRRPPSLRRSGAGCEPAPHQQPGWSWSG